MQMGQCFSEQIRYPYADRVKAALQMPGNYRDLPADKYPEELSGQSLLLSGMRPFSQACPPAPRQAEALCRPRHHLR